MRQVIVGLVGYGFAGSVFHAPLIRSVPGLVLHRIACREPERARRDHPSVQVDADPAALIGDPSVELLVIATPNGSHFPLARAALLAGKHVVIDKPFVVSVEQGQELVALAKERRRLLSVFHNRRWDNDFLTVQRCIASGLLGDVCSYEAHYDRFVPTVDGRWREQPAPGAGVLYDLGAHLIDQALQLFGRPQTVLADIARQRPGARVDDYFHLLLDYGRLKVVLHAGMLVRDPGPRFVVHGTQGSFSKHGLDSQEAALLRGGGPGDPLWGRDDPARHGRVSFDVNGLAIHGEVETAVGSYEAYYEGVHAAIVDDASPPVAADDALNVIRVIACALRSQAEQRVCPFE